MLRKFIGMSLLCAVLAGCGSGESSLEQERQSRIAAEKAVQRWQLLAGGAALIALAIGIAVGSKPGRRE